MEKERYEFYINKFNNSIWYWANKYNINGYDIEDLYQEFLLELWNKFEQYDINYSFNTFIGIVCSSKALDIIKKKKQEVDYFSNDELLSDVPDNYNYELKDKDVIENVLHQAYQNKNKEILIPIIEGFSKSAVAKAVGFSRTHVYNIWNEFIKEYIGG